MSKLENVGVALQKQLNHPDRSTPTSMGSLEEVRHNHYSISTGSNHQDQHQYSDIGFPALPRPKAILSLSRSGSPWTLQQASKLNTVPVRLRKKEKPTATNTTTESSSAEDASRPVKTNNDRFHMHFTKQTKRKSLNGIFKPKLQQQQHQHETDSPEARAASCNNWEGKSSSVVVAATQEMSNRSKAQQAKKGNSTAVADEADHLTVKPAKKTRKPSKSMTFSFGSGSDKKRRTLGFLGKSKQQASAGSLGAGTVSVAAPPSPILVSNSRKLKTLPASSSLVSCENSDNTRLMRNPALTQFGSYQDVTRVKSPLARNRPPPLPPLSSSVGHHNWLEDNDSPHTDYSPALTSISGASSSWRDSAESLTYGVRGVERGVASNPASRVHSPNVFRARLQEQQSPVPGLGRDRKLSDPTLQDVGAAGSPRLPSSQKPRQPIKKRNTFCVRSAQHKLSESKEMRQHVVRFLVETEQSYVESLRTILKVYHEPLTRPQASNLVEPALVKDIFYLIPEICSLHEHFLQQLTERVKHWDDADRKIGDVFVDTFSKCHLMDIYRKFIGNFMRAKASIELAKQTKSIFSKFLEQRARDSAGKLSLDDLLIKPVQRIPRYVLFVKDLLKHTNHTHPDHTLLQQALGELTMLAESVNESERERERLDQHKELLSAVDGLSQLLSPQSHFIRYDMITEVRGHVQKRDRFLILFSDLLVCASSRRKSSSFKRSSLMNLNSVFADGLKYNIKWHVPLTEMSLAQIQASSFNRRQQDNLEKMIETHQRDERVLNQMTELTASLQHPHQSLLAALKELQLEVQRDMTSKRAELENLPTGSSRTDLISYFSAIPTQYTVLFPSHNIRNSWEMEFLRAKHKADDKAPPSASVAPPTSPLPVQTAACQELEFLNSNVLHCGRVCLQVTCAADGLPVDSTSSKSLWVCCADSHGRGQLSLLDLQGSDDINNASSPHTVASVTISDSPLSALTAVPHSSSLSAQPPRTAAPATLPPDISINSISSSSSSSGGSDHVTLSPTLSFTSDIKSTPSDKDDDLLFIDGDLDLNAPPPSSASNISPLATPLSRAQPFSASLTVDKLNRVRSNSAPSVPEVVTEDTRSWVPSPATGQQSISAQSSINDSTTTTTESAPGPASRKMWPPLILQPSSALDDEEESGGGGTDGECSMWLGTEGGQLHIYKPGDNLRSWNSHKTLDLGSAVHCISHLNGSVYVGLGSGVLVVFEAYEALQSRPRWSVTVGSAAVRCCTCVLGEVWIGSGNTLYRVDPINHTLKLVCTLPYSQQTVAGVVAVGSSVWVSVQDSAMLFLLHAPSGHILAHVDCTHAVLKVLKSCDLLTQHRRSTGLHITAMCPSPSHLLVGTSAGVTVAIPLPFVEPSLNPRPLPHPPHPTSLHQGHIGPVHSISVVHRDGTTLVVTGGYGATDFQAHNVSSRDIPETATCLQLWAFK